MHVSASVDIVPRHRGTNIRGGGGGYVLPGHCSGQQISVKNEGVLIFGGVLIYGVLRYFPFHIDLGKYAGPDNIRQHVLDLMLLGLYIALVYRPGIIRHQVCQVSGSRARLQALQLLHVRVCVGVCLSDPGGPISNFEPMYHTSKSSKDQGQTRLR